LLRFARNDGLVEPDRDEAGHHHRIHLTKIGFCGELLFEPAFLITRTRTKNAPRERACITSLAIEAEYEAEAIY
jgi:hypothetical protein